MDLRMLAVAAASRRVGYVFLVGARLVDWRVNEKGARSPTEAAGVLQQWINDLRPDVVVTEALKDGDAKGEAARAVTKSFASTAANNYLLDVAVEPVRRQPTKHEDRMALLETYPELRPWAPSKRRAYDPESRNTVIFDALALAMEVLRSQAETLASAMDAHRRKPEWLQ